MKLIHLWPVVGVALAAIGGCQSWQGANFPVTNATRVPPPGTGTYQLPNGYYNSTNSTSAVSPSATTLHAGGPSTLRPAAGQFPSTGLPATNLTATNLTATNLTAAQPASSHPPVAAAASANQAAGGFTASAVGVVSASHNQPAVPGEGSTAEAPSLQWQQFGDQ